MRHVAIVAGVVAAVLLAGCSLPGQAFPGGPNPWLPGGAPGDATYAQPGNTVPAPAASTNDQGRANGARRQLGNQPLNGARKSLGNRHSVTMRAYRPASR